MSDCKAKEATPFLLEGPVLYALPPVQADTWNMGLLVSDLADSVRVRDLLAGDVTGNADLDDVLFEVSLLERAGLERVRDGRQGQEPLRGLWLVRDKDQFLIGRSAKLVAGRGWYVDRRRASF